MEVRLCLGSGALDTASLSLPSLPLSFAATLSFSLVRRKERNDGGHQFRFKIVYRGAADAIDGRTEVEGHESLEGHAITRKKP